MANVRDSDTSLWLHNKLGASNDLWSDTCSIISQLNGDVLKNIRECFVDLQSQVKLKLLLSFLHISRRSVDEWRHELEDIVEVAICDSDQWVSILAELCKNYAKNGSINFNLDINSSTFTDMVAELKKLVKKHDDKGILPLECLYLNKNALTAQVGHVSQPVKHFTLKRKPKSAALRAELLQKSSDAASGRRSSVGSSVPIRCRGLTNDSGPLRGISSKSTVSGFKAPVNPSTKINANVNRTGVRLNSSGVKRDGGIKLLDITEQPIGRDAKRRKKVTNDEANESKQKENEKVEHEVPTPDYAAGLTSMVPPSPAPPSYAPPSTPAPQPIVIPSETVQPQPQRIIVNIETLNQLKNDQPKVETPIQIPITPMNTINQHVQQQPIQHVQQIQALRIQPQEQQQQQQQQQTQQPLIRRQLQLSREQMLEAQEMFKSSNKVTRPEKALILGFMAGSRENPCPQLGNVVTIKLSENEAQVTQDDGTCQSMVVETHFQMNYQSGEWKKVQKCRRIDQQNIAAIQGFSQHV